MLKIFNVGGELLIADVAHLVKRCLIYRLEGPDTCGPYQTRADGRLRGDAAFRALANEMNEAHAHGEQGQAWDAWRAAIEDWPHRVHTAPQMLCFGCPTMERLAWWFDAYLERLAALEYRIDLVVYEAPSAVVLSVQGLTSFVWSQANQLERVPLRTLVRT